MKINELSSRQVSLAIIVMTALPSFRLFGPLIVQKSGNGAPFSLLLSFLLWLPLLFCYFFVFRRFKKQDFTELNRTVFGKVGGKITSTLYALWFLVLASFYLGQYGARITGTLFYDTDMLVFVILMLFAVTFVLKKGTGTLFRSSTILAYIILFSVLIFTLLLLPPVRIKHFLPLSEKDILPTLWGISPGLSSIVFLPVFFIFLKNIRMSGNERKGSFFVLLLAMGISVSLLVLPLVIFGKEILSKMTVPYFAATRNLSAPLSLERTEAILVAVLIMTDFIVISILLCSVLHIFGDVFETENKSNFIDIIIPGVFMGAVLMTVGDFKIDALVETFIIPGDLCFGLFFPFAWFIAAKLKGASCETEKNLL